MGKAVLHGTYQLRSYLFDIIFPWHLGAKKGDTENLANDGLQSVLGFASSPYL